VADSGGSVNPPVVWVQPRRKLRTNFGPATQKLKPITTITDTEPRIAITETPTARPFHGWATNWCSRGPSWCPAAKPPPRRDRGDLHSPAPSPRVTASVHFSHSGQPVTIEAVNTVPRDTSPPGVAMGVQQMMRQGM